MVYFIRHGVLGELTAPYVQHRGLMTALYKGKYINNGGNPREVTATMWAAMKALWSELSDRTLILRGKSLIYLYNLLFIHKPLRARLLLDGRVQQVICFATTFQSSLCSPHKGGTGCWIFFFFLVIMDAKEDYT